MNSINSVFHNYFLDNRYSSFLKSSYQKASTSQLITTVCLAAITLIAAIYLRRSLIKKKSTAMSFDSIQDLRVALESSYTSLPWPIQVKKIAIFTQVQGGLGDISASLKLINLIHRQAPNLSIDWIINDVFGQFARNTGLETRYAESLTYPEKVKMKRFGDLEDTDECHMLIEGPVQCGWNVDQIRRNVVGPR